jgi:chromosome segregation ATPase
VYVSNVEAPANSDAQQIVRQYVNTLPTTENSEGTTVKKDNARKVPRDTHFDNVSTVKNVNDVEKIKPTNTNAMLNIEKKMLNTDKDVQKLNSSVAQMSKALDIMTEQQKTTSSVLQQTKSEHNILQTKNKKLQSDCNALMQQNAKLAKDNARMSQQISNLQAQHQENSKKLLFKNLTEHNKH